MQILPISQARRAARMLNADARKAQDAWRYKVAGQERGFAVINVYDETNTFVGVL